mmetsp:Transcript_33719/g.57297  ORF Transcript_33719/g.57297 Transcript_33719/m.57297 type:complete len:95 (+) Transcript_33719:844-1128(+)
MHMFYHSRTSPSSTLQLVILMLCGMFVMLQFHWFHLFWLDVPSYDKWSAEFMTVLIIERLIHDWNRMTTDALSQFLKCYRCLLLLPSVAGWDHP